MIDAVGIKLAVMRYACCMKSLDELAFLHRLEEIYVEAYKRGSQDTIEQMRDGLSETGSA